MKPFKLFVEQCRAYCEIFMRKDYQDPHYLVIDLTQANSLKGWLFNAQGKMIQTLHEREAASLREWSEKSTTIVLIPSDSVLITSVSLPEVSEKKIDQMIPYALEEQLTEEIDALHFAMGDRLENGDLAVAVIRKTVLQHYCEQLSQFGIEPDRIMPSILCFSYQPDTWVIQVEKKQVLVRVGEQQAWVFDSYHLELALQSLCNDPKIAKPKKVIIRKRDDVLEGYESFFSDQGFYCVLESYSEEQPPCFSFSEGLNLLPHRRAFRDLKIRTKKMTYFAVCCLFFSLVLGSLGSLLHLIVLDIEDVALKWQIQHVYDAASFNPSIKDPTSEKIETAVRNRQILEKEGSFIYLLQEIGSVLHVLRDIKVQRLVFQSDQLVLLVKSYSLSSLEKIKIAGQEKGLILESGSPVKLDNQFFIELKIGLAS